MLGALTLKIVGNLLFIPQFGILGVAIASNIGLCICAAVALMYYLKKLKRFQLATGKFYRKLVSASMSMVVVVVLVAVLLN